MNIKAYGPTQFYSYKTYKTDNDVCQILETIGFSDVKNLIIEEFQRLQIDMKDIVSIDKNFIRKTVITIAQ